MSICERGGASVRSSRFAYLSLEITRLLRYVERVGPPQGDRMPTTSTTRRQRSVAKKRAGSRVGVVRTNKARATDRESIGYLARYAYRVFARAISIELATHGLLAGQWSVFRVLWEEEGFSQVELANRMRVEKASLTGMLDGMERQGLIVRARNKKDRRKVNIHLSAKGRRLKRTLLPYAGKVNRQATKGLSPADVEQLRALLSKVIANLDD